MSAEEILQQSENDAVGDNQFISHVSGKNIIKTNQKNSYKKFGAAGLLTAMIVVIAVLFSSGNIIPSSISERLIEETDVQYADAVASKELVFQQALKNGDIPKNTFDILKTKGVLVGYVSNGEFIETNQVSGELSIKLNNKIISADNFIDKYLIIRSSMELLMKQPILERLIITTSLQKKYLKISAQREIITTVHRVLKKLWIR